MTGGETSDEDVLVHEIATHAGGVAPELVRDWIRKGWLDDARLDREPRAVAVAAARVMLIRETRSDLGVDDSAVELVVRLIERLRLQNRKLECLNAAIANLPNSKRDQVLRNAAAIFHDKYGGPA